MLNRYLAIPLLGIILEGVLVSASSGYNHRDDFHDNPQNIRPGVSDDSYYRYSEPHYPENGREQIVYMDERDYDIHHRANRRGNWNYKQNWRYDREAFLRGETEAEAYDQEHPDSIGGIGMDPDYEYLQMRRFYLEEDRRNHQAQVNHANRKVNHQHHSNGQSHVKSKIH